MKLATTKLALMGLKPRAESCRGILLPQPASLIGQGGPKSQSAPQFLRAKAGHENLFIPAHLAADDPDARQREFQAPSEESDQLAVGFAVDRGRIQPDFQRISVGTHDLVPRGTRGHPDRQQKAFFRFSQEHHAG